MNINQQNPLQTPFLQPDLLTLSSFISYCKDNGLKTDQDELEYYDKERLLVPAVRVLVGTVEFRKIYADFDKTGNKVWKYVWSHKLSEFDYEKLDPEYYYDRNALWLSAPQKAGKSRGFQFGNDGWLDWYLEQSMVVYPAEEDYLPWKLFRGGRSWSKDVSEFEHASELMYAKHQIYTLKIVQQSRTLTIKNQGLFKTPERWSAVGKRITDMYAEGLSNDWIAKEVKEYNRFFWMLTDISLLRVQKERAVATAYLRTHDDKNYTEKDADKDAQEEAEFFDLQVKADAQALLQQHDYDLQQLGDWRDKLLAHGSFGTGSKSRMFRPYVTRLDDGILNNTEDAYKLVNVIGWFMELLGSEALTARQLILRSMKDHCQICNKSFEAGRSSQATCASPKCIQEGKNKQRREKRKLENKQRRRAINP